MRGSHTPHEQVPKGYVDFSDDEKRADATYNVSNLEKIEVLGG